MKTLADIFAKHTGNKYHSGIMFGVEIEVEDAANFFRAEGWDITHDNSLRNNGMEYVFRKPLTYKPASELLCHWGNEAARGKLFTFNYRTSVHIHVNVMHLNRLQLLGLFKLYYLVEPFLFDDGRWESPYCIPVSQASGFMSSIMSVLSNEDDDYMHHLLGMGAHDYKYMALGTHRLPDLGTLEFRMFNGKQDAKWLQRRLDYVDMIVRVASTEFAKEAPNDESLLNCVAVLQAAFDWEPEKVHAYAEDALAELNLEEMHINRPKVNHEYKRAQNKAAALMRALNDMDMRPAPAPDAWEAVLNGGIQAAPRRG